MENSGQPKPRFYNANMKFNRATSLYNELDGKVTLFMSARPFGLAQVFDPDTRTGSFVASVSADIPDEFQAIAGDVMHNLRASLDHLAVELARENGHESRSAIRDTYFPVGNSEESFLASAKMNRLSEKSKTTISQLKPYRGGNDALWELHNLDILDKHVEFVPSVALANIEDIDIGVLHDPKSDEENSVSVEFSQPNGQFVFPVSNNMVLLNFKILEGLPLVRIGASYSIAFSGNDIVNGRPVLGTLLGYINSVEQVLAANF